MDAVIVPERVVYLAHQLGAPTRDGIEENRKSASEWYGWLAACFPIAPVADWIILTGQWTESMRARGLEIAKVHVSRCDELWLIGPRVTEGMMVEADHAHALGRPVYNLTHIPMPSAYRAPETWWEVDAIAEIVGLQPVRRAA
jgi:hypothetical protein